MFTIARFNASIWEGQMNGRGGRVIVISIAGTQKPKFWRAYSYAKSKIAKRGDTVVFKAKLRAIGNPEKILWQAVSGDNTGTDYAPSRSRFAKLKVG